MTSRRESIINSLATSLASTSGVSGRVYRSRTDAIRREETPLLMIEPAGETCEMTFNVFIDWTLSIKVAIHNRGDPGDGVDDAIAASLYSIIMADRTVGGLAMNVTPSNVTYEYISGDQTVSVITYYFVILYRTPATSL
jgi:hypothetical protein